MMAAEILWTYALGGYWLWAAVAVGVAVIFASYWTARNRVRGWRMAAFLALRMTALAAVLTALAGPYRIEETQKPLQRSSNLDLAVLVDRSESMGMMDAGTTSNRLEFAEAWIAEKMLPGLPKRVQAVIYGFNEGITPASNDKNLPAPGGGTDIPGALETLATLVKEGSCAGVILVSDGINHSDKDVSIMARHYRERGIPVSVLPVGSDDPISDVSVEEVILKPWKKEGTPAVAEVRIHARGRADEMVPLEILHEGRILARQEITVTEGTETFSIAFNPVTNSFHAVQVRLATPTSERLKDNDSAWAGIELDDPVKRPKRPIRVLYLAPAVAAHQGWYQNEFKFVRRAFERDPEIQVTVLHGWWPPEGVPLDFVTVDEKDGYKVHQIRHPTKGFPRTLEDLLEYDVIFNASIYINHFSKEQLDNMVKFVEEHGGGMFVAGGDCSYGPGGYQHSQLEKLLPVVVAQRGDISWGIMFQPVFRPEALVHPIFQVGETPEETREALRSLPEFLGYNRVVRTKPGAFVLWEHPQDRNEHGPIVIMAAHEVGKGRVIGCTTGIQCDWGAGLELSWGKPENPKDPKSASDRRYYAKWLSNTARWLAAGKRQEESLDAVLHTSVSVVPPRQAFDVNLKPRNASQVKPEHATLVRVFEQDRLVSETPAPWNPAKGQFEAALALPTEGVYRLEAVVKRNGATDLVRKAVMNVRADDPEKSDIQARPAYLEKLAQMTGGQVLRPDEPFTLNRALLHGGTEMVIQRTRHLLWDKAWVLALILLLLTAEWTARRLVGMA